jgi:hypothetical protein
MKRAARRALVGALAVVAAAAGAHGAVRLASRMTPPAFTRPAPEALRGSYTRVRAGVREVYLEGSPEQIGFAHATLLRDRMIEDEHALWNDFTRFVPVAPARALVMDIGLARYRDVDQGIPEPRRRELAAQSAAFDPDPFAGTLATYQRMVLFHSLYDIALSFEHSPLIGCSSFVLGPSATRDGHTLLGRAFDFEAGEQFDRDKAVFFVKEDGAIPFASVAWPGLVGVMSGMNAEGVAIVVHGARAREPRTRGEPVIFTLRDVLQRAHDVDEAVAILRAQDVMVSHLVLVADARGKSAVVERAPGAEAFVRPAEDPARVALTNHFEGPLASDPRNVAVKERTTTLARRARLDAILASLAPHEADAARAVAILRDHQCAGDASCALGDRRAIDALIATHGVVADTTDRALWVSAGPHLSGAFVRFDLKEVFAPGHVESEVQTVPAEDPSATAAGR